MESFYGRFGVVLGSLCVILGLFWSDFGIILWSFGGLFGGVILESFQRYSTKELFRMLGWSLDLCYLGKRRKLRFKGPFPTLLTRCHMVGSYMRNIPQAEDSAVRRRAATQKWQEGSRNGRMSQE